MVGGLDELSKLNELRGYESTEEEELMLLCSPHLSSLTISNCPNLTSMPLFPTLDDVLHLYDTSSVPLQQTMKMRGWRSSSSPVSSSSNLPLSNLKELNIWSIEDLESLPDIELQNLSSSTPINLGMSGDAFSATASSGDAFSSEIRNQELRRFKVSISRSIPPSSFAKTRNQWLQWLVEKKKKRTKCALCKAEGNI